MKRCSLYMFLSLAAILAVLSACGDGEIVDVSSGSPEYAQIMGPQGSLGNLVSDGAFIDDCSKNANYELCQQLREPPQVIPSSSSELGGGGESSSSETGGGEVSSSSIAYVPSSSSNAAVQSSSSAYVPSSTSNCTDNCATVPAFTCTFDKSTVVSGDDVTVNFNITGDENCTMGAIVKFDIPNIMGINPCTAQSLLPGGSTIKTSGTISGSCESRTGTWSWPLSGAVTTVEGAVTCGAGSTQKTETKSCGTINVTAAPKPTKKAGTSITFSNLDYTTGGNYFYIGTIPAVNNTVEVGNNGASPDPKCETDTTTFELEGNTTAAGPIKAVAVVTCRGTKHRLDSTSIATVVPNPTLSECTWSGSSYKDQMLTPSATLTNNYGRCGAGEPSYSDGFPRKISQEDVNAGKVSGVTASVICDGVPVSKVCPDKAVQNSLNPGGGSEPAEDGAKIYVCKSNCPAEYFDGGEKVNGRPVIQVKYPGTYELEVVGNESCTVKNYTPESKETNNIIYQYCISYNNAAAQCTHYNNNYSISMSRGATGTIQVTNCYDERGKATVACPSNIFKFYCD